MPDPLAAVREAERLVREATERAEAIAAGAGDPPPRGWDAPGGAAGAPFPDLARSPGCSSRPAARCRPSSRASSRRRCASC